jgi:hypothetical protein
VTWFDLKWFTYNKASVERKLKFWGQVLQWLDPHYSRIKVYKTEVKFWSVDKKGNYDLIRTIKLLKDDKVDVEASKALDDAMVWALAHRLKYLQFPRTWKRISRWYKCNNIEGCFKTKEGKYAFYIRDGLHGQSIHVPTEMFTPEILDELYRRSRLRCI